MYVHIISVIHIERSLTLRNLFTCILFIRLCIYTQHARAHTHTHTYYIYREYNKSVILLHEIITSDSTRMLFATWWIFILILTSFYTANLTAFLTKPQFTLPINNIKDIVNKGYKWVTLKGRVIDYLLSQVERSLIILIFIF